MIPALRDDIVRMIDQLYDTYKLYDVPSVTSFSKIERFADIFDKHYLEESIKSRLSLDDEMRIRELSTEFQAEYNMRYPIYVVPEYVESRYLNHEVTLEEIKELCKNHVEGSYTLPPVLSTMSKSMSTRQYVDAYINVQDDGNKYGLAARRQAILGNAISKTVGQAQDLGDIIEQAQTYRAIAKDFNDFNNSAANQIDPALNNPNKTTTDVSSDDDFEFEFDE